MKGVVYAKCTIGVCILTVVLQRTLVTVEYEEKRKSQCTAPDKMPLFRVKVILVASARPAEERRKSNFDPCWLAPLESFAFNVFMILIINLLGKRCHACLKLQDWRYCEFWRTSLPYICIGRHFFPCHPKYSVLPYSTSDTLKCMVFLAQLSFPDSYITRMRIRPLPRPVPHPFTNLYSACTCITCRWAYM